MPKSAAARGVEARGNRRRSRGVFPNDKVADDVICHVGFVQKIEIAARHGTRSLREIDKPVHRLREFGRAARSMPQLARDELWIHRAGSHDPRQSRRQRTRPRPRGIGGVENDEIGRAPERGRSRSEPTDERDIFRSFQQIAYRIFGGMDEHIRGCDPGFKCARRGRRYAIRAAIGMGDGGEIRASDLHAIEIPPEKIFNAGAIGARSGTKNAHHG